MFVLKVLQRATHCYKTKRSKYSAKKHQCNVLGRLLNRGNYTLYVFFLYLKDLDLREGYTLEKWPQSSSRSLIYSCFLLFGTFIIPIGIILCFCYCVVKKVLANARKLQTTVNDKQILKERERWNKWVMVILLAIAGAFFVFVFPNQIIWVILDNWYQEHSK